MTNKDMTLLQRWNQWLIPAIFSMLVAIGAYTYRELQSHRDRIIAIEEWRITQSKALLDAMAVNTKERDTADEAMRVRILREVETAASTQRENVLAQLAAMQRDLVRISIFLELQRPKDGTAYKPQLYDPLPSR